MKTLAGSCWIIACAIIGMGTAAAGVVINEVYFEPADSDLTEETEFVELLNVSSESVDLTGWRLADGIEFLFPNGTSLAGGGVLVVAKSPPAIKRTFGVDALGPWTGKLSNNGEEIELRDNNGGMIDRVDYRFGFPWPSATAGSGSSMELLNPALDNDLGSSWRSSTGVKAGARTFVPKASRQWLYRPGSSEASTPTGLWRATRFSVDGTWRRGQTPIGYSDGDDNTVLRDMMNRYSCVFLRHQFNIEKGTLPSLVTLRTYVDDGARFLDQRCECFPTSDAHIEPNVSYVCRAEQRSSLERTHPG